MRPSRIIALTIGYFVYFIALGPAIELSVVLMIPLHKSPIEVIPYISAAIGLAIGVFGAHRDGTRLGEYIIGSSIYIVLTTFVIGLGMAFVSLKPLPLVGLAVVGAIGPLLQCVCVGMGYVLYALWQRRDRCPLWRLA